MTPNFWLASITVGENDNSVGVRGVGESYDPQSWCNAEIRKTLLVTSSTWITIICWCYGESMSWRKADNTVGDINNLDHDILLVSLFRWHL